MMMIILLRAFIVQCIDLFFSLFVIYFLFSVYGHSSFSFIRGKSNNLKAMAPKFM